ncbi:uncharacterized protein LOC141855158 [Brevipalpus obovatus]|uniref:uncharacterized protein LOC141855158 n=1 Tax=Brevipalpus obovatus TaxID=246614 RepID=UPI003D9F708C
MVMSMLYFCVFLFLQGHLIGRSDAADIKPPVISYRYTDPKDNVTCMMAEFSAQLKFSLPGEETVIVTDGVVDAKSTCGSPEENLIISFTHNNVSQTITFTFVNTTEKEQEKAKMTGIGLKFNETKFEVKNEALFEVPLASSYRCESGLDVTLNQTTEESTVQNITLSLRDMRFDVFRTTKTHDYDSDYVCAADIKGNKTVPMIVAFVLAGMVVIILVGYLILRKREDRSAYQSV